MVSHLKKTCCTSALEFQGLVNNSYLALCRLCAGEVKESWKFLPGLVKNLKKCRSFQNWCFTSTGHTGEMSRLYKILVRALPHQWCQVWGNSDCNWAGNNQMPLEKWPAALEWRFMEKTSTLLILVSSFHPLSPSWAAEAAAQSLRDVSLLLCPTHPLILLLPPSPIPLDLVFTHRPLQCPRACFREEPGASRAGHIQAKEAAFLHHWMLPDYLEGVPGRKSAGCTSSSARAVLNQRQKCDYQVNLTPTLQPCFEEKNRCVISQFFLGLPETPYIEGCRHKHWSSGCPRWRSSGILIYSHSGFGKVIRFLKQKKETEKKNNKPWWCISMQSLW